MMPQSNADDASAEGQMGANVVRLTFLPAGQCVEFEIGKPRSILDVAIDFGIDLDHACGGSCACSICHVVLRKGEELLSECTEDELDRLDMAADLQLHSRLACQAMIERPGELVVEIPDWNRNYARESGSNLL